MNQNIRSALEQIAVLAEYGTTGPDSTPRCKSDALTGSQATSLRGSISQIARETLTSLMTENGEQPELIPGTLEAKRAMLANFCNSIRDRMLERSAQWPEEWDGHELRELAAYAFDSERTLDRPPQPARPRDRLMQARARKAHDTIISKNLY